jgi:hypothetical protein
MEENSVLVAIWISEELLALLLFICDVESSVFAVLVLEVEGFNILCTKLNICCADDVDNK